MWFGALSWNCEVAVASLQGITNEGRKKISSVSATVGAWGPVLRTGGAAAWPLTLSKRHIIGSCLKILSFS